MPTYDYACPKCGHRFEQFQKMTDAPLRRCPRCKKLGIKRLIGGGSGLIFKGSGFYSTDYRKGSSPKEGAEGGAKPAGESMPAASPSPAAPAAKPSPAESGGKK